MMINCKVSVLFRQLKMLTHTCVGWVLVCSTDMVVCCWPQVHVDYLARLHLCRFAWHGSRKRLSRDGVWQVRSKPRCQIVTSEEADDQCSFHCTVMSTGVLLGVVQCRQPEITCMNYRETAVAASRPPGSNIPMCGECHITIKCQRVLLSLPQS